MALRLLLACSSAAGKASPEGVCQWRGRRRHFLGEGGSCHHSSRAKLSLCNPHLASSLVQALSSFRAQVAREATGGGEQLPPCAARVSAPATVRRGIDACVFISGAWIVVAHAWRRLALAATASARVLSFWVVVVAGQWKELAPGGNVVYWDLILSQAQGFCNQPFGFRMPRSSPSAR